jgi:DNA-binding SARP family transcriptional activator
MGRGTGLRIGLLGGFSAKLREGKSDPRAWRRRHHRALVELLALTPGRRLHREQVMEALWPELDPVAADNNLRKALHRARRALTHDPEEGASLVASLGGALSLASDAWIDVEAFTSMAEDARRSRDPLDYERAIALYRGDLLPEDRYEPWVVARSDELRNELAALLLEQAGLWEARGEIDRVSRSTRRR